MFFLSLQASVSKMEQQLTDCESALVEETVVSQKRKRQVELAQYQVAYIYSLIKTTPRINIRVRNWIWLLFMTLLERGTSLVEITSTVISSKMKSE